MQVFKKRQQFYSLLSILYNNILIIENIEPWRDHQILYEKKQIKNQLENNLKIK